MNLTKPILNVITIDLDNNMELGTINGINSLFEEISKRNSVGNTNTKVCLFSEKLPRFYVICVADMVNNAFKSLKQEKPVDYFVVKEKNQFISVHMKKVWEHETFDILGIEKHLSNKHKTENSNTKIQYQYIEKLNIPGKQASKTPSTSDSKKVCLLIFDIDETFIPHGISARENFIKLIQDIQNKFKVQVKIAFNTGRGENYTRSLMDIISRDFEDHEIHNIIDYSACENGAIIIKKDDPNIVSVECGEEEKGILKEVNDMVKKSEGKFTFFSMGREYYAFIGLGKNGSYEDLKNKFFLNLPLKDKIKYDFQKKDEENKGSCKEPKRFEKNSGLCLEAKKFEKSKAIGKMMAIYEQENVPLTLLAFSADASEKNYETDLNAVNFVVEKAKSKETSTQFRVFLPKNIGPELLAYLKSKELELKDIAHQGQRETLEGITDAIRDCIEKKLFLGVESEKNNSDTQLTSSAITGIARSPVLSGETHIHKPSMPSMQL